MSMSPLLCSTASESRRALLCSLLTMCNVVASFCIFIIRSSLVPSIHAHNSTTMTPHHVTSRHRVPWIYVITPTSSSRIEQKADLTRLAQTLALVNNVHWILIEDAHAASTRLSALLKRSGVAGWTHLAVRTTGLLHGRGMEQRNLGLDFLREHTNFTSGVVYFADDDNTYDRRLFDECIRHVRTVGVWPVGLVGGSLVETPNVNAAGKVVGFNVNFLKWRKFATDMAGFGVHLSLLRASNASFHSSCHRNMYETCFIEQLGVDIQDLQPLCIGGGDEGEKSEVLVWHTKTRSSGRIGGDKGYDV